MHRLVFAAVIALSLSTGTPGQQPAKDDKPVQLYQRQAGGFISPSEVNVRIEPDVRTFIVMAAVNVAGFDYETAGQPLSPARAELRRDLAGINPQLKQMLAAYYQSHRRAGVDEVVDALRYEALSFLMSPPPSFSVYQAAENLPDDLRPLIDFGALVGKFYLESGIKQLLPKYMKVVEAYGAAYRVPAGQVIFDTLEYFHAKPETIINMRPYVVSRDDQDGKAGKGNQRQIARSRTRYVFVALDPLAPIGTSFVRDDLLNQKEDLVIRRTGDDYIVVIGPSRAPAIDALREAMIRFVIDPILERHLKASLDYKDQIVKLVAAVPTAGKQFGPSVYLVLRESLAQAAEARMKRVRAAATHGSYGEDDAVFDLAGAYKRGAVLSFHFYESLIGLEKVGINIEDFFDQMLATAKFDREAQRLQEVEAVVARVSEARRRSGAAPETGARGGPPGDPVTEKIVLSDDLIRQRRFAEARPLLQEILKAQPDNARALYGMAQVINQTPSAAELDPKADENDKIQGQHDRLEQAIKLYRKAIETASPGSERWLIQWSHVFVARILDFQEFRADAVAEYDRALALGDLPDGAYKEALEGKQRPYGQK